MGQQLTIPVLTIQEIDGVEMGILKDGTPFLTGRSLAKLCGAAPSAIFGHKDSWAEGKPNPKLLRILEDQGYVSDQLFVSEIKISGGTAHAYPDVVCTSLLEYFAFDAQQTNETALRNFRRLARGRLRDFIYQALGYDPQKVIPEAWRQFHDRLLLDSSPVGYFNVFREMADFALVAMRLGMPVDEHNIPDISVGKAWSEHWKNKNLETKHGARMKHEHNYPSYFAQAKSNPQYPWVYPIEAIVEFKKWMVSDYIPKKFPSYLDRKVDSGAISASTAELLLSEVQPKQLPPAGEDE